MSGLGLCLLFFCTKKKRHTIYSLLSDVAPLKSTAPVGPPRTCDSLGVQITGNAKRKAKNKKDAQTMEKQDSDGEEECLDGVVIEEPNKVVTTNPLIALQKKKEEEKRKKLENSKGA